MKSKKIYIAGHKGMVGSAVWRALEARGYKNVLGCSKQDLDLRNQHQVNHFFQKEQPEIVIDAAALVGGIMANKNKCIKINELENIIIFANVLIDKVLKILVLFINYDEK